jgi:hypothetical protein
LRVIDKVKLTAWTVIGQVTIKVFSLLEPLQKRQNQINLSTRILEVAQESAKLDGHYLTFQMFLKKLLGNVIKGSGFHSKTESP